MRASLINGLACARTGHPFSDGTLMPRLLLMAAARGEPQLKSPPAPTDPTELDAPIIGGAGVVAPPGEEGSALCTESGAHVRVAWKSGLRAAP